VTTIRDEAFNDSDPPPLPLDVDLYRLGRLLRKIEATADASGWGAGMSVYLVYDNTIREVAEHFDRMCGVNPRMGRPLRLGPYSAQRFAHPAMFRAPGKHDFEMLRTFAVNLAYGDDDRPALMRSALRVPGVRTRRTACAGLRRPWRHLHQPAHPHGHDLLAIPAPVRLQRALPDLGRRCDQSDRARRRPSHR
jgi:hypothetical protein